ncbi:amidohydrolase [Fusibacter paucivorans]|uniref:Amidohydrolase n=1 Tax=Fusibacter paucivorans TaxID=76009 RepID=A0ABS5PJ09_9FIRM|nr:amidohydrolase [Fusibacter paucivorans]MBS7525069.1 amidohydrolase [Fusibacter paucivorans]
MYKNEIKAIMHDKKTEFEKISDMIWDTPELKFKEFNAVSIQKNFFEAHGFLIKENLADIETAFSAEYGSGSPIIAFLGEYDALPKMSQVNDITSKKPVQANGAGHGCGHHLLGTAAMEAAYALKVLMAQYHLKGTVRYYGCPAEEGGSGKAFMVREGVFNDVDAAFSWHPGDATVLINQSLSNARVLFNFKGVSSHAAAAPHLGRSALDAVELMNVGTNYLREHIIPDARIHYAILNAGGDAPNIVPPEAESIYAIRAPKLTQVVEILNRVTNIAKGAALMTETVSSVKVVSAYANLLPNKTLDSILENNINLSLPIKYTTEEIAYAKSFNSLTADSDPENPIKTNLYKFPEHFVPPMSTDVGDVSWLVPTTTLGAPTFARGTQVHNWMAVAQGKSSIAHKGMHFAALVLACSALDILENPDLLKDAHRDLIEARNGDEYKSIIPSDIHPGEF